ncbi:pyrimidine/purine nucleoside phosphorylase [Pseudaeromonas paramecii]|uniref:Pyrimidine/purine nucleoside phosphorylase n=1 Tax=Pseudaeromonas paramecii TaxID=2138166 RepID=A0ABP8Q0C1_9GAMM
MLQVNEYFDGKVKSIGFANGADARATVGVMAPGEYTFNTGAPELMVVIRGALTVLLPGQTEWVTFAAGQQFDVPGNSSFQLQVASDTAYLCEFK